MSITSQTSEMLEVASAEMAKTSNKGIAVETNINGTIYIFRTGDQVIHQGQFLTIKSFGSLREYGKWGSKAVLCFKVTETSQIIPSTEIENLADFL